MLSGCLAGEIIDAGLDAGGDFVEIFFEDAEHGMIDAYPDRVENSAFGREYGAGIRIFKGLNSAYVHTNDLVRENLIAMTRDAAKKLNKEEAKPSVPRAPIPLVPNSAEQRVRIAPSSVGYRRKMDVVRRALDAGSSYAPEISQMFVKYLEMQQEVWIANSEGAFVTDKRVKTRLFIMAYAENGNGMQSGYVGPGAMRGFEFYESLDVEGCAREAARVALTMLNAEKCPGGQMSVVVENGFGGLLFHEACGHSLEAGSVAKGTSEFSGRLGQLVASPLVTLVDDGSLENQWGSLAVDDEGTPTRRNVLIEKGILKGYMVDRLNGRRMGLAPTGSARRQNCRFAPTSRMTNTFIENGLSGRNEIIADTEKGLYVRYINGGSVDPATGEFNFAASESYAIRNGKIAEPLSGATLIGKGGDILLQVDKVGNNLAIGQGFCFAESGPLFIGAGQPTVRIASMTVGGVR